MSSREYHGEKNLEEKSVVVDTAGPLEDGAIHGVGERKLVRQLKNRHIAMIR